LHDKTPDKVNLGTTGGIARANPCKAICAPAFFTQIKHVIFQFDTKENSANLKNGTEN